MKASKILRIQCRQVQRAVLFLEMLLVACLLVACSREVPSKNPDTKAGTEVSSADCLDAVNKVLGADAQLAKCGHLVVGSSVYSVGFVRLNQFAEDSNGIPVSRLVILQKSDSQWNVVLDVARQIQNQSGYVGIDYIDDSVQYPGYRASFLEGRSDGKAGFVLQLRYMKRDGKSEGVPIEISWNTAVGRFQEFSTNQEPEGFKTELKNPPHIHSAKP